jgi:hypothetical protein
MAVKRKTSPEDLAWALEAADATAREWISDGAFMRPDADFIYDAAAAWVRGALGLRRVPNGWRALLRARIVALWQEKQRRGWTWWGQELPDLPRDWAC